MSSMSIFTDPVVTCPYDKYHRVPMSKIQGHIVRCEKNYPVGYKEICPYNATHRLFKHELQDHIKTCPQQRLLDTELYQCVENHGSTMSDFIAQSIAESTLDHGESWDEEFQKECNTSINGNPVNCDIDNPLIKLRTPRGYSEVMMIGQESDVPVSDIESVVSVMGIGRGRIRPSNIQLYKRLNYGRGRGLPRNE